MVANMKTILPIIAFFVFAQISYAQKATIESHPNFVEISKQLQTLITETSKKQATYFSTHGKYFQGVIIPVAECDGATGKVAEVTKKPTDQAVSWEQFDPALYKSTTALLFNTQINTYRTPSGQGWGLAARLKYNDVSWIYTHAEGAGTSIANLDKWEVFIPYRITK